MELLLLTTGKRPTSVKNGQINEKQQEPAA